MILYRFVLYRFVTVYYFVTCTVFVTVKWTVLNHVSIGALYCFEPYHFVMYC
jgi:hypothetical protein